MTSPSGAERKAGSATSAQRGTVSTFDEREGLGEVTAGDGTIYPFHSIAIADGTRTIAVGADVQFEIVPGGLGRWEAAAITAKA